MKPNRVAEGVALEFRVCSCQDAGRSAWTLGGARTPGSESVMLSWGGIFGPRITRITRMFFIRAHPRHPWLPSLRRGIAGHHGESVGVGRRLSKIVNTSPNKPAAANPAIASGLHGGCHWRGVAEPGLGGERESV